MSKGNRVVSPAFTLMNSTWKLEMMITNSNVIFHHAYQVSLRNTSKTRPLPEFELKVYIDHQTLPVQYRCTKLGEASAIVDTVYKARFDSVSADTDNFESVTDLTIVCLFIPSTGLALNVQAKSGE